MILNMNSKSMGRFNVKEVYEEQSAINGGYDSISLLPDCILDHILSYLPTKEAVATSVLSKRWKYLWTFVPILDFDDSLLYSSQFEFRHSINVTCFMNFVDKVLLQRDKSNVKRFRLSCRVCFSASRVNEWILSAVKQNVQELDLCLFVEEPFVLPACVFDNEILTVIKLEMNCNLHLPPRISIPSLKTLHLRLVTFPNDNNTVQSLFSSCPFLEELAVLDYDSGMQLLPDCALSSLKTVDYTNFCGTNTEIWFLRFLLKNAVVLEKMNVYWSKNSSKDQMNQWKIKEQLHALPKGSLHCALLITT
ncbi:hypothetical protein MIMGU_mgv1a010689mg [Erythranthe guttata]|uniref:F-box domain-containing protein n=1 Tax=Erythranthe guttata TaxID=4155 RepID=A0A022PWN7_ERYGU|nr:hypothetical protein MIMGU_mgv1a010689mg [Erythranthe guttata]